MSEKKKALVFIADGSEEMEVVITVDVLRRAEIEVDLVGVKLENSNFAKCSRGVKIVPDHDFSNFAKSINPNDYDVIVVPGGYKGAETLSSDNGVQQLLSSYHKSKKIVSAICAGPLALKAAGVFKGCKLTSHYSVRAEFKDDYTYLEDRVVVDNNVITSQGPGTAFLFALTIVEQLLGKEKRDQIAGPLVLPSTL